MKQLYFVLLVAVFSQAALAQNQKTQDPSLRPHHSNLIHPAVKGTPVHKNSAGAAVHHHAIGNVGAAPAKNGTDAQLTALEHQQATLHNPKPAPKVAPPIAAHKANTMGTNQPMNFTYKAPNANNAPVGGVANGRKPH